MATVDPTADATGVSPISQVSGVSGVSGALASKDLVVKLDYTSNPNQEPQPFSNIMYTGFTKNEPAIKKAHYSIKSIKDLEQFLIANTTSVQAFTPTNPDGTTKMFDEAALRKLIFTGIQTQIGIFIGQIMEQLKANINPIAIADNPVKAAKSANGAKGEGPGAADGGQTPKEKFAGLPEFDYNNDEHIAIAKEIDASVELKYTDTLTKTGVQRTVTVKLSELCDNIRKCKTTLESVFNPQVELIQSQSQFIKCFLGNILEHKVMNVPNARALFETLTPTEQCNISEDIKRNLQKNGSTWKELDKYPCLKKDEYSWKNYCYICNSFFSDSKKQTPSLHCEHVLYVVQACSVDCLIQKYNKEELIRISQIKPPNEPTETEWLSVISHILSYLGADECCNILKSDTAFIDIVDSFGTPQQAKYSANAVVSEKNIKEVLDKIRSNATKTDSSLDCHNLQVNKNPNTTSNCNKAPSTVWQHPKFWKTPDIDAHFNRIATDWLQPLCDVLNSKFERKSGIPDNTYYSTQGLTRLFMKMLLIIGLEVSLPQVICCLLAGGGIRVPARLSTKYASTEIDTLLTKTGNNKSKAYEEGLVIDIYIADAFGELPNVAPLITKTKRYLENLGKQVRASSRVGSKSNTPIAAPELQSAPQAQQALTSTMAPMMASPNWSPLLGPLPVAPLYSLQTSMYRLNEKDDGPNYTLAIHKHCFNITPNISDNIFNDENTQRNSTPNASNERGGFKTIGEAEGMVPMRGKLRYYLQNLATMLYGVRRYIPKIQKTSEGKTSLGYGFTSEITAFITLCKSYIAVEFMYILTYNLYHQKISLAEQKSETDKTEAVTILESCISNYNKKYITFIIEWFFYSSIYIIDRFDINLLTGYEAEEEEETSERESSISETLGYVYLGVYQYLQINYKQDLTTALGIIETEIQQISNANIADTVGKVSTLFNQYIETLCKDDKFTKLIRVKEYVGTKNARAQPLLWVHPFDNANSANSDETAPVPVPANSDETSPVPVPVDSADTAPTGVGGGIVRAKSSRRSITTLKHTMRGIARAKSSRRSNSINRTKTTGKRYGRTRTIKAANPKYRVNYDPNRIKYIVHNIVHKIEDLENAVYNFRAYDIGYDIINDGLITLIYRNKYKEQQNHLDRIQKVKAVININKAARAEYALTNLLGYTKGYAKSRVQAILHNDNRAVYVNEILTKIGEKLTTNIYKKIEPNRKKPLLTLRRSISQTALSSPEQIGTKRPRPTTKRAPLIVIPTNKSYKRERERDAKYKNKSFMSRLLGPKRPKNSVAVLVSSQIPASKKRSRADASRRFEHSRKLSRLSSR